MNRLVKFEWSISKLYVDFSEVSDGNPNKLKLIKAIEFLRTAELCSKETEKKKLVDQAWASLLPMQLEVNYSGGDLFDGDQIIVEITSKNTDWNIWTNEESIGFNLCIKFEMETTKNVTDKKFDAWERKHGWDWMGVSIAIEGYEMDNGSSISHSIGEE